MPMANSSFIYRCIQLIAQDAEPNSGEGDGPIDCYVYLEASGDSPIGIQGWHYRQFSAAFPIQEIMAHHLRGCELWEHKAPPEFQEWRVWLRLKDAHPDLPRGESPAFNRAEALEAAERLRLAGNQAGVEVLTHENGWVPAFLSPSGATITLTGEVPDDMADTVRRMTEGEFEPDALAAQAAAVTRDDEVKVFGAGTYGNGLLPYGYFAIDVVASGEAVITGGGTVYTGEADGIYAYGAVGAGVTDSEGSIEITGDTTDHILEVSVFDHRQPADAVATAITEPEPWSDAQAISEGWMIVEGIIVATLLGNTVFEGDNDQARTHVEQQAAAGSAYHQQALRRVEALRAKKAPN